MDYVRVSSPEQIKELSVIGSQIFREYYMSLGIHSSEQNLYMIDRFLSERAIAKQISEHNYHYFFFCDEGKRVGFCAVQPNDGKLFLSKLYLSSENRGKGYGREALSFVKGVCAGIGLHAIWLTVNRGNKNSIEFYRHNGFEILRSENFNIGNGYVMDDFVMELKIK